MKKYLKYIIGSSIALGVILIDIITKILAVKLLEFSKPVPIFGEFLTIQLYFNTGMVFSFLENAPRFVLPLTSILMSVVIGFLLFKFGDFKKKPVGSIALALMLGGAMGNMIDRTFNFPAVLYTGPLPTDQTSVGVVDFINTQWLFDILHMPNGVWNIADGCLVVGTIALAIHLIFLDKDDKKDKKNEEIQEKIKNDENSSSEESVKSNLEESEEEKND